MANYVGFYKETIMKIYAILFDMVRKNVGMEDIIKSKGLGYSLKFKLIINFNCGSIISINHKC